MPAAPSSISRPSFGIPRISPPSQSSEAVPVAARTAPAPSTSKGLNKACPTTASNAACKASAASAGTPSALPQSAIPRPTAIIPTCPTVAQASSAGISVSSMARSVPANTEAAPASISTTPHHGAPAAPNTTKA